MQAPPSWARNFRGPGFVDSAGVLFHEQMERSSNCAGKNSIC